MEHETANKLSEAWTELTLLNSLADQAFRAVVDCEDRNRYSEMDAAFLRDRIEGCIEKAQSALDKMPEGETE